MTLVLSLIQVSLNRKTVCKLAWVQPKFSSRIETLLLSTYVQLSSSDLISPWCAQVPSRWWWGCVPRRTWRPRPRSKSNDLGRLGVTHRRRRVRRRPRRWPGTTGQGQTRRYYYHLQKIILRGIEMGYFGKAQGKKLHYINASLKTLWKSHKQNPQFDSEIFWENLLLETCYWHLQNLK